MLKHFDKKRLIAGVDEAGRGCLAGPVVAAACILDPGVPIEGLDDSKKLSEKRREFLRPQIESKALAWGIGVASPAEIDEINILQASFLAMHRAIEKLTMKPEHLLIDGNRFKPYKEVPYSCEIKGDGRYFSIAAASILAKTERDRIMTHLHDQYPSYDWKKNKGYPTVYHRAMVIEIGKTEFHRQSFAIKPLQLTIFSNQKK